jgi:hypothetical protein
VLGKPALGSLKRTGQASSPQKINQEAARLIHAAMSCKEKPRIKRPGPTLAKRVCHLPRSLPFSVGLASKPPMAPPLSPYDDPVTNLCNAPIELRERFFILEGSLLRIDGKIAKPLGAANSN